eukprot:TRINITY_DN12670_c0_g1_i1.p1 TRINITY_DN12670_c0_g1~~TRINITY_DN12670_c0_g1_i1.p1  ORF type:complete len:191 (-),score=25.54 TRINITY_DN12670_c0_g1_i1:249-821(-)
MEVQYILTSRAGLLDFFNGIEVVPKGVESVISISNWTYEDSSNSLMVVLAIGSSNLNFIDIGEITGGVRDSNATFFRVSEQVIVDGVSRAVLEISHLMVTNWKDLFPEGVDLLLLDKYGHDESSVMVVNITFPPGAKEIVYGTSLGSGRNPFEGLPHLGVIIGVTLGGLFVLFALVSLGYHRKRIFYERL